MTILTMIGMAVLMIISVLALLAAILVFVFSLIGEEPSGLLVVLALGIICGLCIWGAETIETNNTTITTETVQMEITKLDLTDTRSANGGHFTHYYASVTDGETN